MAEIDNKEKKEKRDESSFLGSYCDLSDIDVTKCRNHIFWLYGLFASLFCFVLFLYNEQCNNIGKLKEEMNDNNIYIQIELATIAQRTLHIEGMVLEMRKDIKEGLSRTGE